MKTEETRLLEDALMADTIERRTFGCPEVTIGWFGKKRVDFMKTNTKGLIWCYEIKVTKSDFHSVHGHNFEGNYNYYVVPEKLYKQIKDEVPAGVGILVGRSLRMVKRAKYKKLPHEKQEKMKLYLVRSMSREVKKSWTAKDSETQQELKRRADYWKRQAKSYKESVFDLEKELRSVKRRR